MKENSSSLKVEQDSLYISKDEYGYLDYSGDDDSDDGKMLMGNDDGNAPDNSTVAITEQP